MKRSLGLSQGVPINQDTLWRYVRCRKSAGAANQFFRRSQSGNIRRYIPPPSEPAEHQPKLLYRSSSHLTDHSRDAIGVWACIRRSASYGRLEVDSSSPGTPNLGHAVAGEGGRSSVGASQG